MMRHHVVLQVALVAKLVATDRTSELLLPVVPVREVSAEVALLAQAFVADWAVELEEASVDGRLVQSQIVLRAQQFTTDLTCKLSTSGRHRCCRLTIWGRRRWETTK